MKYLAIFIIFLSASLFSQYRFWIEDNPAIETNEKIKEYYKKQVQNDLDTVIVKFVKMDGARFIKVDIYTDSLLYLTAPYPGMQLAKDKKIYALINAMNMAYITELRFSNADFGRSLKTVLFTYHFRNGKRIRGIFETALNVEHGYSRETDLYKIEYLTNYNSLISTSIKGKGKKAKTVTIDLPERWENVYFTNQNQSYFSIEDKEYLSYLQSVVKFSYF